MPNTWDAIFLGNFATMLDPTEGNSISENASAGVGLTFGTVGSPIADDVVTVTAIDNGGSATALDTDGNATNDQIQFDLGGGVQTTSFDGIVVYNATITYIDGTTANVTAVVFQDVLGNVFLAPEMAANTDTDAFEAKGLRSLTLDSISADNSNLATQRYDTDFICFGTGTELATPSGLRRVETLQSGDFVTTMDAGLQQVIWAQSSRVSGSGKGAPVCIRKGALGKGLPIRDLYVSRQHRVLVNCRSTQHLLGLPEVFVPAFRLLGLPGIELCPDQEEIIYWHILLASHHILFGEGAAVESLLPGEIAIATMSRLSLLALWANVQGSKSPGWSQLPVRPVPSPASQKELVSSIAQAGENPFDPVRYEKLAS